MSATTAIHHAQKGKKTILVSSDPAHSTDDVLGQKVGFTPTEIDKNLWAMNINAEKQAKDLGYEINVGKFPFSASGKANAAGHSDGFVKVIFDKKYGEWLGCHMVGYNVTEMIAEVVAARKLETTAHEIIKSVHPHPTMSEAIMEATAAAYNEVIHL